MMLSRQRHHAYRWKFFCFPLVKYMVYGNKVWPKFCTRTEFFKDKELIPSVPVLIQAAVFLPGADWILASDPEVWVPLVTSRADLTMVVVAPLSRHLAILLSFNFEVFTTCSEMWFLFLFLMETPPNLIVFLSFLNNFLLCIHFFLSVLSGAQFLVCRGILNQNIPDLCIKGLSYSSFANNSCTVLLP